jgi:hypothetical protein
MQRSKNFRERITTFSREKTTKFLNMQMLIILAVILMLYPSASAAGGGTWGLFVALSLAMFLIPLNTYIYEKGFVKTSVISLFSAFVLPSIALTLIMLSPGNSIAAAILFFVVLGASILLGYLAPPMVLIIHYLKRRWVS